MIDHEKQRLLDEYAAKSRAYADAVQSLRHLATDVEAFIRALADTGAAHRASERSRIQLEKHLAHLSV